MPFTFSIMSSPRLALTPTGQAGEGVLPIWLRHLELVLER